MCRLLLYFFNNKGNVVCSDTGPDLHIRIARKNNGARKIPKTADFLVTIQRAFKALAHTITGPQGIAANPTDITAPFQEAQISIQGTWQ
uniref:Uncharacterized protein n=1 Tax=Salix viminalis TaxID=40686 RepID=A0A6N2KXN4_SALVM